jgi:hypothetical protein
MDGRRTLIPARARTIVCADSDPIVSFLETGAPEPRPRLLVERLLYTWSLLQSSPVLGPRFVLGDCAAAHHIVLGGTATSLAATDRLWRYGFRVEPSATPRGIRFFVSSSHTEAELRALVIATTIVVRELAELDTCERAAAR